MVSAHPGGTSGKVFEIPELRDRTGVFADRAEAGRTLAGMLEQYRDSDALVLAIPAGGVPVAAEVARELGLELDVAVVSKITLPWNTEAGYGAVAFDGSVSLNRALIASAGLTPQQVDRGIAQTTEKVRRRVRELRGDRPLPDVTGRTVILVDDGLASGYTMRVAADAVRGAGRVIVAIPTAHADSIGRVLEAVDAVYCCNIRGGYSFAVASAYRHWYDVGLDEVRRILGGAGSRSGRRGLDREA